MSIPSTRLVHVAGEMERSFPFSLLFKDVAGIGVAVHFYVIGDCSFNFDS